jgi:hypothetical protein
VHDLRTRAANRSRGWTMFQNRNARAGRASSVHHRAR